MADASDDRRAARQFRVPRFSRGGASRALAERAQAGSVEFSEGLAPVAPQVFCERPRLHWRENIVPGIGLWQLFVYDPSAVLLELTFAAAAEGGEEPKIPLELPYKARERFFHPEAYAQFMSQRL